MTEMEKDGAVRDREIILTVIGGQRKSEGDRSGEKCTAEVVSCRKMK